MAARLIYSAITSLDGYVADADGNFDWSLSAGVRIGLDLQDERRFGNGVVHLRYRVTN